MQQEGSFATLTHARLRVAQGDVGEAARILRAILQAEPAHEEARALLLHLEDRVTVIRAEADDDRPAPVATATAGDLAVHFRSVLDRDRKDPRVDKLTAWIDRATRNRGGDRVR